MRYLLDLEEQLIGLIERNRRTFLPGRTLLQHARPISFGLKAAGWLDGITRCRKMLQEDAATNLSVQFGGAVGSLAASGPKGLEVLDALAQKLELGIPELPWHTQRNRIGRIGMDLALAGTALAKIALDVVLMMQTEVAELAEDLGPGGGGSSTLPHKQNPIAPTKILANAKRSSGARGITVGVDGAGARKVRRRMACGVGGLSAAGPGGGRICGSCSKPNDWVASPFGTHAREYRAK